MSTNIQRVTASSTVLIVGFVSLTFLTSSVYGQSCNIGDTSEIDEASHEILHDFDTHVPGCNPDFGPSGIVYHPSLDRLIVISDKGSQFATMKTDGSEVDCRDIRDALGSGLERDDHEGVTFAHANDGFIYVGVESGPRDGIAMVRQVELSSAKVVATWRIGFPGGVRGMMGWRALLSYVTPLMRRAARSMSVTRPPRRSLAGAKYRLGAAAIPTPCMAVQLRLLPNSTRYPVSTMLSTPR